MFLQRQIAFLLQRSVQQNAPVLLQGPRGAGKTTLIKQELHERLYVDLNDASDRAAARNDPASFLSRLRRAAVIDELQRAPELIRHLQARPSDLPIVFVSDARQRIEMTTLELHPPTRAERLRRPAMPLELLGRFVPALPDSSRQPALEPEFSSRRREFLFRDIPHLIKLDDVDVFERFLDLVEQRTGELLHQQAVARELGVAHRTVVRWLQLLDSCFLTLRLEAMDLRLGRRILQRPKLHWLGSRLNFETEVATEIYRNACHTGLTPAFRYWRDSNGLEIPLIVQLEAGEPVVPLMVASTPTPADEARLRRWMKLAGLTQGSIIGRTPVLIERRSAGVLRYALAHL